MTIKHLFYSVILASALGNSAIAQEVKVKAEFDTSRIYIGDQIYYNITVEQPSDLALNIQTFKDTLYRSIEILSGPATDSTPIEGNRLRISNNYLITSFDTGFYEVPPVFAESRNTGGLKRFYSEYALLEVARVNITPSDTASKIFDIIGPYRASLTVGEIIPWLLLVILAAALVWGLVKLIKRLRKNGKEIPVIVNPDPAHVIAFRELEKLKIEMLWQKGEVKLYYSRLTEILRQYLENRYRVLSLEMTTSETLEALVRTGFKKNETYNLLKTILTSSDFVKFAKYKPDAAENDSHFDNAWRFIQATMIQEEEKVHEETNVITEGVS